MLRAVHRMASRITAAAVALALSGAPQLVEPPEHPAGHRCQCPVRHGKHECDCPLCHAEAARAGKSAANDAGLPPCHRALAARSRAEADRAAQRRAASSPCLTSSCGSSDSRLRPLPAADRFMAPPAWQLSVREVTAEVPVALDRVHTILREPETPPPRRA